MSTIEEYAVALSVPLFIRLLEFAREDANSDLDLHFIAENVVKCGDHKSHLTMKDYDNILQGT
jgi:hypothetical protein